MRRVDVSQNVQRLSQVRYLKGEVELLSALIGEMESVGPTLARGASAEGIEARWRSMIDALDARRWRCMELLGALYAFIDDVADSRVRQVLTLRYIYGECWQKVARHIGEADEQYPRRLHNRFLAGVSVPGLEDVDGAEARRRWQARAGAREGVK